MLMVLMVLGEAVYFKINVKRPGLFGNMHQSELDLSYYQRYICRRPLLTCS